MYIFVIKQNEFTSFFQKKKNFSENFEKCKKITNYRKSANFLGRVGTKTQEKICKSVKKIAKMGGWVQILGKNLQNRQVWGGWVP